MKTQTKTTKSLIATAVMAVMTASLAATAIPATASAQPVPPAMRMDMRASDALNARIANLRDDIRMGERTHRLSPREASRLTGKLNSVASLKRSYDRGGLTRREINTLNGKLDVLQGQIRVQGHDGNRR